MTTIDPQAVADNVGAIRALIAQRGTRPVTLVAVTKRFGPEAVEAVAAAGVTDIGENYAQEMREKADLVASARPDLDLRWHFIGSVQRNKVRLIADVVDLWQTVDRVKVGREIANRAPGARVLVQVNLAGTATQSGVAEADVAPLVDELRGLDVAVEGLMMIGRADDDAGTAALFGRLRSMADEFELEHCSMGMTGDLPLALDAGATIVRVGTALFGPRPGP